MLNIQTQIIQSGYDRKLCWTHARAGCIPADEGPPVIVATMHAMRLSGCDVYYEINDLRSDDFGKTWIGPMPHKNTLGRRRVESGMEDGISDLTPAWHAQSGKLLATGHTIRYKNDNLIANPRPRSTVYTVYNPVKRTWTPWAKLSTPANPKFSYEGAGSTQRLDLPNGDILLPTYFGLPETSNGVFDIQLVSTVMRCKFDGEKLEYLENGSEITLKSGRGMCEPSITKVNDRFFLTLRNSDSGYVTSGIDGLHYDDPKPWTFDDGSNLGNYNTQQHWVTHDDDLYLVYTRKAANNDNVFRHRAPLFIAKVDQQKLCVLRDTEQILVPNRGARLGNFGITPVSSDETWVMVSEWMQTIGPDPYDCRVCESFGSDNSIFIAKIKFE